MEEQTVHEITNTYFVINILIKIDYLGGWDNSIYQFPVFFPRNTKYDVLRSLPFVRYNTCLSPPPKKNRHLFDHQLEYNICLPQMSQKVFETFILILLETRRPFVQNKMDKLCYLRYLLFDS